MNAAEYLSRMLDEAGDRDGECGDPAAEIIMEMLEWAELYARMADEARTFGTLEGFYRLHPRLRGRQKMEARLLGTLEDFYRRCAAEELRRARCYAQAAEHATHHAVRR